MMKQFMSIKDTATYSGLSQFYIRNRCKNGTIPHRMMGKKYMVDYEAFIEREHKLAVQSLAEYFVSVRHPRPQEVRHPHRENPTPIPHRWCMAAARIAHGRHAVGSFRNCVQPSHGLAFNGQYMRVVNDTVADGIGHGRIIKQLMPAGDVELRTEDSGCHLTPGFN